MLPRLPFRLETWFGVAFGLVIVVGLLEYAFTRRLQESNRWVEHTDAVLAQIESVRSALTDVGSSAKSYAMSGSDRDLAAYESASQEIYRAVNETRRLTADNPAQQENERRLGTLVQARLAASDQLVAARRFQSPQAAD